jgi:hypothetical protein
MDRKVLAWLNKKYEGNASRKNRKPTSSPTATSTTKSTTKSTATNTAKKRARATNNVDVTRLTRSEMPAQLQDFVERRANQLRGLDLTDEEMRAFIEEDLELLNNITTIRNIDTLILRFYADDLQEENKATKPVRALTGFAVDGLQRMNASANNNDCLIHSFLTSTSENFRRLAQRSKDEFANFFRRTVFLTLPVVQCFMQNERGLGQEMARRVMGRRFLEEHELQLLAVQFRVNILAATDESKLFQEYNMETLSLLLPGECLRGGDFTHTISIFTSGAHFEALRDSEGYTFNQRKVNEYIRRSQNAANAAHGGVNNMSRAIAASIKNAATSKKPAINRKALANSLGISVADLNAYTNDDLKALKGGSLRRTRRSRRT